MPKVAAHEDLLAWLSDRRTPPQMRSKVVSLLEQMLTRGEPISSYRPIAYGPNRIWLRSNAGGPGGTQFYLYWAPRRTVGSQSIDADVYARAVRHHDDVNIPLSPTGVWTEITPYTFGSFRKSKGRYAEGG